MVHCSQLMAYRVRNVSTASEVDYSLPSLVASGVVDFS